MNTNTDEIAELSARLDAMAATQNRAMAELAPVRREAAKKAQIDAIEAQGYVVKETKGARQSGTVWAGLSGAAASVYAAWELLPGAMVTGEWDTFGAAAGAAVTAVVAVWRRYKVGDLRVVK